MPELPEVETIRRDLSRHIAGQRLASVAINYKPIFRGSVSALQHSLRGTRVRAIKRRGKLLLFEFTTGQTLLIHLKMTGQLLWQSGTRLVAGGHGQDIPLKIPNKHTHAVFSFADGGVLFFNDLRKFGYIALVGGAEKKKTLAAFGPEPLLALFTPDYLWHQLRRRSTCLKAVLLNQSIVAGLGNIYVDEAAFLARVRPSRRANRLTRAEVIRLHRSIQMVLRRAIKLRGTTFSDYRDAQGRHGNYVTKLNVYGRAGQLCRHCRRATIKKITVAGRGTHYCPICQN